MSNGLRRSLRTELEILRSIQRYANGQRAAWPRTSVDDRKDVKYTSVDRLELQCILSDASHPIVDVIIAQFDMELGEIRKGIAMSVVNEELAQIVTETTGNGAMPATALRGTNQTPGTLPPEIDDALSAAEADLARAVGAHARHLDVPAVENVAAMTAELTVLEFDREIRELTAILSSEVSQQGLPVTSTFTETIGSQEKTDEAYGTARGLLNRRLSRHSP